jgi:hypothetical protein
LHQKAAIRKAAVQALGYGEVFQAKTAYLINFVLPNSAPLEIDQFPEVER